MINYVTKKPLSNPYYSLQQQFGSYDQYRTTVDATGPINQDNTLLYRFNGAYQDMQSFRQFIGDERVFIAPTLTWKPNEKFEANLELEYKHDTIVNDNGIPAIGTRPALIPLNRSLLDNDRGHKIENVLIGFNWTYHFNDDWKLTNRFQWQDWNTDFYSTFPFGMQANNALMDRGLNYESANVENHAINLDLTGKFELFGTKHSVLIGGDNYHSVSTYDGFWGSTPLVPPINIYNPVYGVVDQVAIDRLAANDFFESKTQWYGIYFQDQITLWDNLHILGGGRYDWADSSSGFSGTSLAAARASSSGKTEEQFSPRVGILYQPWKWLSVYGNYTESFADSNGGRSFSGSPFDPQKGEQFEVGFKLQTLDQRFSATVAFYDLTKSNLLTADPEHDTFQVQIGEAKSQGVEIDLKGQVTEKFNLIATYAYTDVRITKDNLTGADAILGNQLSNVARNQGSLWGTYQFTDRFKIGLGGVAVDQRQGNQANDYQLPGYVRMDAMAAYSLPVGKTRLTTQVNINNLLDKDYYASSDDGRDSIIPGEPISVMGSLKLEY
jgi:iron complex outermembrane recepter protein